MFNPMSALCRFNNIDFTLHKQKLLYIDHTKSANVVNYT